MAINIKKIIGFSIGTWIGFVLSFIVSPILTYLISPSEFGKLTLIQISQTILFYIITIGLDQSFVRFFHDNKRAPNYLNFFLNTLFPTIVLYTLLALSLLFFHREVNYFIFEQHDESYLITISLLISLFTTLLHSFAMQYVRMKKQGYFYSLLQVMSAVINYGLLFILFFYVRKDFLAILYSQTAGNAIAMLIIIGYIIKVEKWTETKLDFKLIAQLLKFGLPFLPVFFIDYLFNSSDKYFLRLYTDLNDIGLYSFAFKISSAFTLLQAGFVLYWVPFFQENYAENPNNKTFYRSVFRIVNFGLALCITGVVCLKDLLFYLIQVEYHETVNIVPYLLLSPYFLTLSEITGVGINLKLKTNMHLVVNLITLLFNLIFGLFLIKFWGIKGASINIGITFFIFFISRSYFGHQLYNTGITWKYFIMNTLFVILLIAVSDYFRLDIEIMGVILLPLIILLYFINGNIIQVIKTFIKKNKTQ